MPTSPAVSAVRPLAVASHHLCGSVLAATSSLTLTGNPTLAIRMFEKDGFEGIKA